MKTRIDKLAFVPESQGDLDKAIIAELRAQLAETRGLRDSLAVSLRLAAICNSELEAKIDRLQRQLAERGPDIPDAIGGSRIGSARVH